MILFKKIILISLFLTFTLCAAPKGDFAHTLNLAKYSTCKDMAEDFTNGKFKIQNHKSKIQNSLFPWRFEVTNGYQEGFVYYALLGYSAENSGDIPFAYRCYQNSLACIDEEKSFDYPLPRSEIYLAIGRTCLAAGRYMDAKAWLDTAFLESGDNIKLQAAIDRVLIQRANEIGDYPEIIFLYQHLESLANKKTPRLDKEGCPKGGVVERTTDHGLRTTDYANYAQILFYSRKDREGFSKLLTGISKLGIDNNLGVKDPLVEMFLNNIMRADDDEVKFFYDLLGWAIVDARAKAGDENYLAFLCNARTLFCKVYDFLEPENDLKKVKKRIDIVKRQLADGNAPWSACPANAGVARGPRPVRKRKNPGIRRALREIINGEMEKTPEIFIEDLLMLADWKLKQRDRKTANTNYYLAFQMAIGKFANLEYDGTTAENAAIIGMKNTDLKTNPKFPILDPRMPGSNFKFQTDNSYRAAKLTLQLYIAATNDEQRAEYDTEAAMNILPIAHPKILRYLIKMQLRFFNLTYYDKALEIANEYCKRKNVPNTGKERFLIFKDICKEDYDKAIENIIKLITVNPTILHCFGSIILFPTSNQLLEYRKRISPLLIPAILQEHEVTYRHLVKIFEKISMAITINKLLGNGDEEAALSLLTAIPEPKVGGNIKMGYIYLKSGETNMAYECGLKAFRQKCRLYSRLASIEPINPVNNISNLINLNFTNNIKKVTSEEKWLKKRVDAIALNKKKISSFMNKQFIKSKYLP